MKTTKRPILNPFGRKGLVLLIITALFLLPFGKAGMGYAQIITTVAGSANVGYGGDGGPALSAILSGPWDMSIDAVGNIYIADTYNNCIRKVNTMGIINSIAGNRTFGYSGDGGAATSAEFAYPLSITTDAVGNVYITDSGNNCIRKINTSNIISTIVGNGTAGYIGDGGPATAAELNGPGGFILDTLGNLYIADGGNNVVRKINTAGIITTIAGGGTGGVEYSGPATAARLNDPEDVAFDTFGNMYISDWGNNVIRKVNTSGIITTIAGNGIVGFSGDGGQATVAELNGPNGITFDALNNLYIADGGNNVIRIVNTTGIISIVAGNGYGAGTGVGAYGGDGSPATAAKLNLPTGITFDILGNLYIADNWNARIRKVTNVAAAGIEQVANNNEQVMVYPNPTTGMLNVEGLMLNEATEFTIVDMLGNIVYHSAYTTQHNNVDISEFNSGVYVLELSNSKGKVVKRLIKE